MYDPRPTHQAWKIETAEQLMWTLNEYEASLKTSRRKARYLFNCLFDYGMKSIDNKINIMIKLEPRPIESFNQEETNGKL